MLPANKEQVWKAYTFNYLTGEPLKVFHNLLIEDASNYWKLLGGTYEAMGKTLQSKNYSEYVWKSGKDPISTEILLTNISVE